APAPVLAFPGALGWARTTPGGRGGAIVRVTTLDANGPGSFRAAIETKGPRIIVFEVGGVVDLGGQTVRVTEPFLTIAGQTAPSPGVTFIRGGFDIATHDVIVQHIRVRAGSAGAPLRSGRDFDSISTIGAANVIVDHCTLTWGTDENLSASGPRFTGSTPAEWRAGASHAITFSNNIIAESLANSTHAKGEHSKGSLIHDNASQILIVGNLYAHNYERNPLFKGGVQGVIVNNLIYNPGQRAIHYNLMANEWGATPPVHGQMVVVGNIMRAGPNTPTDVAFVMLGGDGDLEFHGRDNLAQDRLGRPVEMFGRYTAGPARFIQRPRPMLWPEGLEALPSATVEHHVLTTAGARPWDRDPHDVRVLADTAEGRGRIIDNESEVGGYPVATPTRRAFDPALWDIATMTAADPRALDNGSRARGT
ncbi:MAG: pectate lyase, partial [Alphaproteobacteria bacterium]